MSTMRIHFIEPTSVFTALCGAQAVDRNEDGSVNTCHYVPDGGQVVAGSNKHCPECLTLGGVELLSSTTTPADPYQWPDVRTVNAPDLLKQAFDAGVERGRYEGEEVGSADTRIPPAFDEWYAAGKKVTR